MPIEIIAEAGVNHSGNVNTALKMIDAAKAAGADTIKFQTYCPEEAINPNHRDFSFLKSLALTQIDFIKLKRHCDEVGIEFLSTPGDVPSLKFLVEEVGVRRIKIGSDDLTYRPLIKAAADTGLPLIISTGMADIYEVSAAIAPIKYDQFTLLHCVSAYPCSIQDANLRAMKTLSLLVHGRPVGYSDHCQGILACIAAASLGAVIIEKHFELAGSKGPDTDVSVSQWILAKMITRIREVELLLGTGVKVPCEAEMAMIPLVRKREDGRKMA